MPSARRILPLLLLGLNLLLTTGFAQEGAEGEAVQISGFPGLSQVVPHAADLFAQADQDRNRTAELKDTQTVKKALEVAEERFAQIGRNTEKLGDPRIWNLDTLLEVRSLLDEEEDRLQNLLAPVSERLETLESIASFWEERRAYWQQWQEELTAEREQVPQETFARVFETIEEISSRAAEGITSLVFLQEQITELIDRIQQQQNILAAVVGEVRSRTFEKIAPSFGNPDFYRQFTRDLLMEAHEGLSRVQRIHPQFYRTQAWILALQFMLAVGLGGFIRRHRRSVVEAPEWNFILLHPWATGLFVSLTGLGPLYTSPPALWRLLMWFLASLSAAILISGLVRNPLKRVTVYLLAGVLVFTMTLQIISLPQPLYRIYLTLICLFAVPLLITLARRNTRNQQGRKTAFTRYLQAGAALAAAALVAQAGGYSAFSARLVEASLKSVFLLIFIVMLLRLVQGGVQYLFNQPLIAQRPFFDRFGQEVAHRLKNLLRVLAWIVGFFMLLQMWGVYDTLSQAWKGLFALEISLGQIRLTLDMIVLALLVLYLSIVGSWFIRAFLEAEIFPRQNIDRGVRDSIKRLLHYFLVFVGFIFAMSLAGFELENFAVLAGALGIGIGFGLQNIVNNFVSGLILLFERPIKMGDILVIDDEWGTVKKIGLRSTVIETLDQSELIVPNSQFISEKVTNWTLSTTVARVVLPVGVAYGSNIELVLKILHEAADTHPLVLATPSPSPIFVAFGNSSLDFELRCWIANIGSRLRVRSDLGQFVDRRFREEGVEIPFPQRDLHLRTVDSQLMEKATRGRLSRQAAEDEHA